MHIINNKIYVKKHLKLKLKSNKSWFIADYKSQILG